MRIIPYITYNGNCADAVVFYEKAFNTQAHIIRYKDAPPNGGVTVTEETGNLVMHAQLEFGNCAIMLSDAPPDGPVKVGDSIVIMAELDDAAAAKAAFDILKEGGEVSMDLQETFWSKYFGSLTDKFGVYWHISVYCGE